MNSIFIKIVILPIFFYGFANWLIWQNMKQSTNLPANSTLKEKAGISSKIIKFTYFILLIKFSYENGWYYIFSFIIVWYLSGWLATLLERYFYMDKVMKMAIEIIDKSEGDIDVARNNLANNIPDWWVLLMPNSWRKKIEDKLRSFLN